LLEQHAGLDRSRPLRSPGSPRQPAPRMEVIPPRQPPPPPPRPPPAQAPPPPADSGWEDAYDAVEKLAEEGLLDGPSAKVLRRMAAQDDEALMRIFVR